MLILASQSPRRKALLESYGFTFQSMSPNFDESSVIPSEPKTYVTQLAYEKAAIVFKEYPKAVIIAADTIVYKSPTYFGKPRDRDDAIAMLKSLSNSVHQVYTGVCILTEDHKDIFYRVSNVTFKNLSDHDIVSYIDTFKPFDKAGAYGIQEQQNMLVESYDGDYLTIVGFPMQTIKPKLDQLLKK